jgi:hypothetical protein
LHCVVFKVQNSSCLAGMVGSSGLEPPTSRLSGVRSNRLSYEPINGGDERSRTADPLLARQVLYQLSYTPTLCLRLPIGPSKLISVDELKQYSKSVA